MSGSHYSEQNGILVCPISIFRIFPAMIPIIQTEEICPCEIIKVRLCYLEYWYYQLISGYAATKTL
jgi:hypothetical protein